MPSKRAPWRTRLARQFAAERRRLGRKGVAALLDEGRAFGLAPVLERGGALVFPHANLLSCGHQIAAVVEACLDTGADTVLVVGVLHAQTPRLWEARARVAAGGDLAHEPLWGLQGPGIDRDKAWRDEFSLSNFLHLWKHATRRRRTRGPRLVLRYPFLVGDRPDRLPGVEKLETLARDAVVVTTADPFHHGIGYGTPPERALHPQEGGLALARERIEHGLDRLGEGDYAGYLQHCIDDRSDARDAGPLTRHLVGPCRGAILDLTSHDTAALYEQSAPTWVATALMTLTPVPPIPSTPA